VDHVKKGEINLKDKKLKYEPFWKVSPSWDEITYLGVKRLAHGNNISREI